MRYVSGLFFLGVCTVTLALSALTLAQTKPETTPTAPVPAQILSAKKVFIANAGGDEMAEGDPMFTGGPNRAFNQFYTAVKSWGRFEVVGSPAEADLLLEIRQEVQRVDLGGKVGGSATPLFSVKIRDPKTNALLWAFHIHGKFGMGQGNSDKNFDQAVNLLLMRLRALVASGDQP